MEAMVKAFGIILIAGVVVIGLFGLFKKPGGEEDKKA